MIIQLTELNFKKEILIKTQIDYSNEYIKSTDIKKLNGVLVDGSITKDYSNNYIIKVNLSGTMYLLDAITLDEVPYEFNIEIEENLENSLKSLDLIEFLWHYIVLEIPIRYTTADISNLKDIYQDVYKEEEIQEVSNPFKDFFKE